MSMSDNMDQSSFGILPVEQMSLGDFSNSLSLIGNKSFGLTVDSFKRNESLQIDTEHKESAKGVKEKLNTFSNALEKDKPFASLQAEKYKSSDAFKDFKTNPFDRIMFDDDVSKSDIQFDAEELNNFDAEFSDFGDDLGEPLQRPRLRKQELESFHSKVDSKRKTIDSEADLEFIVRRGVGCGSDSNSQSEIDTEDEVQAVLQKNQRDCWITRPGLEGGNSKDCLTFPTSAREGAEGSVVTSPVPGDGGGGGDGSSGHSDTDSNPGSEYTQGSTLEILQGLRFQPSRRTKPVPEKTEARICPLGNEDMSKAATDKLNDRPSESLSSLFADSSSFKHDLPYAGQDSMPEYSGLMSRFLRPTSLQLGDSLMSLEQSSKRSSNNSEHLNLRNAQCRADGSEAVDLKPQLLPVVPNNQEIDFSDDQISARSSSFGVYSKQKSSVSKEKESLFNSFGLRNYDKDGLIAANINSEKKEGSIYVTDEGEFITPLAYRSDLRDQFGDEMQKSPFSSDLFEQEMCGDFSDDQFLSSDKALEVMQKDEEKFEMENKFIKEDAMTSVSLGKSWTVPPTDEIRQSWMSDIEPYMRISIGQFIRQRTEALGSLDKKESSERPYFGTKVITPPKTEGPKPLLDSICKEDESSSTGNSRPDNVGQEAAPASENIPSDLDLVKAYKNASSCPTSSNKDITISSTADETFGDRNSMMSVSCITKLIADASVSADPLTMANAAVELSRKLMAYKWEQQKFARSKQSNIELSSSSKVTNSVDNTQNPFAVPNKNPSLLTNAPKSDDVFKKPESSALRRMRPESGKFQKFENVTANKNNTRDMFGMQNNQSDKILTSNQNSAPAWEALRPSSVISRLPVNDDVAQPNVSRNVRFEIDQDFYNTTPSLLVLESKKNYPTSTPYFLRENMSMNFSQQCPSVILEATPKPAGRYCAPKSLHNFDSSDISTLTADVSSEAAVIVDNNQTAKNTASDRFVLGTENESSKTNSNPILEKNATKLTGTSTANYFDSSNPSNGSGNQNKTAVPTTMSEAPSLPAEEVTSKVDSVPSSYFPLTSIQSVTNTAPAITTIGSSGVLSYDNMNKFSSVSTSNSHFNTWSAPATIFTNSIINQQKSSLPINKNVFTSSRPGNSSDVNENYNIPNKRDSAPSKMYESEEHQVHFSHLMDSRPLQQCASIKLPQEITFTEVCCVGIAAKCILPLQNPTSKWLKCTVQVVNFVLDGQSFPSETSSFTFKRKTVVEPNSTEDIPIVYMPRVPGSVVAQLKVSSQPFSSDKANPPNPVVHIVVLRVKAEHPQIEILADNEHSIDFGTLAEESVMDMNIGLINTGQATVPLKLVIHENSSGWQGFYFPKKNRDSSSPTVRELLTSTSLSFTMKGHSVNDKKYSVVNLQISFRAPALNQADLPLKQFLASLNIEVDSSGISNTVLDNLTLIAHVGMVKLHTLTNMEPISLRSDKNKPVTVNVPLRNSGTIAPLVEIAVQKMPQLFTISPHSLTIPPGHETSISITYNPQGNFSKVKSLLLLSIVPGGPTFEIQLIAEVISHVEENYPIVLETSLKYVTFGGVSVGNAESKSFVLKNSSSQYPANLSAYIGDENMDFWLQDNSSADKKVIRSMQFSLQPLEERPIFIVFAPKQNAVSSSRIILKPLNHGKLRYTIPVQGYGGSSQIQIENVRQDFEGFYWLPLKGHLTPGTPNIQELIVKNSGERAAYVKAIVYTDFSCQQTLKSSNILVSPCEFVLASGSSTKIIVAARLGANSFSSKTIATLGIYTGDEVMRNNFRRCIHKKGSGDSLLLKSGVRSINFDVPYQGEDTREGEIPSSPDDLKLFYATMLLIRIDLRLLETSVSNRISFERQLGDSQQTDYGETKPSSPPVRESCRRKENLQFRERRLFKNWEVQPNEVYLQKEQPNPKKIQIVNSSDVNLRFQVMWPGHTLMVTPAEGFVSARSKVVLDVAPVSTAASSEDDWKGVIFIKCGDEQQEVKVIIKHKKTEVIMKAPSAPPLYVESTDIKFPSVYYCESSEFLMNIKNVSEVRQQWILSSRAPTEVMELEDDGKSYTANYTVFKFSKLSGQIEAQETAKIPIHFLPLDKGLFIQYWDIITKDVNQHEYTIGIKLQGRGLKDGSPSHTKERPSSRSSKSRKSATSKPGNTVLPIQLEVNKLEFQETVCGNVCCLKITMNNISKSDCKIKIVCGDPVFQVNHTELIIMKRRFIKLPIYFKPTNPGYYNSTLTIKMDNDSELSVELLGVGVKDAV